MFKSIHDASSRKKFSRRKSSDLYIKVLRLRKSEHSYTEIRKATGLAKSTISDWLRHAGLTTLPEHFKIQAEKRVENYVLGTAASQVTRARRKDADVQKFIQDKKQFFNDAFFVAGIMLYEAEGSKSIDCKFSNSDYRLIVTFVRFLEKYMLLSRSENMNFDLCLHETRMNDLDRVKRFWSVKIGIPVSKFRVYWKKNKVVGRKENMDYVGQILVRVCGEKVFGSKLMAVSDIILARYLR
jgi:hypothetical protein